MTSSEQLWLEYWADFSTRAQEAHGPVSAHKPGPVHWYRTPLGCSDAWLYAAARVNEHMIGVVVEIVGERRLDRFRQLEARRSAIEAELGCILEWREWRDHKSSRILFHKLDTDVRDRADWPAQHQWLLEKLMDFHRLFAPLLQRMR